MEHRYYFNIITRETTWKRPSPNTEEDDEAPLAPGWAEATTPDGRRYYYQPATKAVTWKRPVATDADKTPLPDGWKEMSAENGKV